MAKKTTTEVVKGSIYEATKLKVSQAQALTNYATTLTQIQTFEVTDSNIGEADELRKKGDSALRKIDELYKTDMQPTNDIKSQKELAWNEVRSPFVEAQNGLKSKIKDKKNAVSRDVEQISAAYVKDDQKRAQFFSFINEKSTELAATDQVSQVVLIEKRFGSEKSREKKYEGLWDELKAIVDIMKPYMTARKEHLLLLEEAQIGGHSEDGPVITEIRYNMKAEMFEMMTKCTDFINTLNTPAVELDVDDVGGRMLFRFEITDEAKLLKKHPELFAPVPAKVLEYAKTMKHLTPKSLLESYETDGLKMFYIKSL